MTLKIDRNADRQKITLRLSGRLRSEHLGELTQQIQSDQSRIALDLSEVVLVDVEAVRFLNTCEENGIELLHCAPFIREWMRREQDREG